MPNHLANPLGLEELFSLTQCIKLVTFMAQIVILWIHASCRDVGDGPHHFLISYHFKTLSLLLLSSSHQSVRRVLKAPDHIR
jgi:hypothetical protein